MAKRPFWIDQRKYPRYRCRLLAYLNRREVRVKVDDVSLEGCFVEADRSSLLPVGSRVSVVLFLPCIGPVAAQGIVRHHGSEERPGMGIEFVHFPRGLHKVYAKFVKLLPMLEEARKLYQELISKEEG